MSLSLRLSRIEVVQGNQTQQFDLVAVDEADAERLFEETILRCRPGQCSITIRTPTASRAWSGEVLVHEDMLALLH